MNFCNQLLKLTKNSNKKIVFPEASFSDRTIKAVQKLKKLGVCEPVLIGDESSLVMQNKNLGKFNIINPKTSQLTEILAQNLFDARKNKGLTLDEAKKLILNPHYFSTMLVKCGYADGMVGGAEVSTKDNLKPALQLLKNENSFVNSYTLIVGKNGLTDNPFIMTDCGLIENPSVEQLPVIAKRASDEYKALTKKEPKVAFLSYSTYGSANSESTQRMSKSQQMFKLNNKNIKSVGEVQLDSALLKNVANLKMGQGKDFYGGANVLVFPELNSANICYKAISYFGKLYAIGPITVGLKKPVNDLSRGATVMDIVYLTAITVLQCKKEKEWKY